MIAPFGMGRSVLSLIRGLNLMREDMQLIVILAPLVNWVNIVKRRSIAIFSPLIMAEIILEVCQAVIAQMELRDPIPPIGMEVRRKT